MEAVDEAVFYVGDVDVVVSPLPLPRRVPLQRSSEMDAANRVSRPLNDLRSVTLSSPATKKGHGDRESAA
jgi:hypothetical protein